MNQPNCRVTTPTPSQFSIGLPRPALPATPTGTKSPAAHARPVRHIVRFELEAPSARRVALAGTFNDWDPDDTPLIFKGGDKWATKLLLASGRYEYRYVVDGQWVDDPKAKIFVANPHGGRNAVLQVE